jgi:hypothetical protein
MIASFTGPQCPHPHLGVAAYLHNGKAVSFALTPINSNSCKIHGYISIKNYLFIFFQILLELMFIRPQPFVSTDCKDVLGLRLQPGMSNGDPVGNTNARDDEVNLVLLERGRLV